MTNEQYDIMMKILRSTSSLKLGNYTFKIEVKCKDFNIYEFNQYYSGVKTILFTGTYEECMKSAKDCVGLMYGVIS